MFSLGSCRAPEVPPLLPPRAVPWRAVRTVTKVSKSSSAARSCADAGPLGDLVDAIRLKKPLIPPPPLPRADGNGAVEGAPPPAVPARGVIAAATPAISAPLDEDDPFFLSCRILSATIIELMTLQRLTTCIVASTTSTSLGFDIKFGTCDIEWTISKMLLICLLDSSRASRAIWRFSRVVGGRPRLACFARDILVNRLSKRLAWRVSKVFRRDSVMVISRATSLLRRTNASFWPLTESVSSKFCSFSSAFSVRRRCNSSNIMSFSSRSSSISCSISSLSRTSSSLKFLM